MTEQISNHFTSTFTTTKEIQEWHDRYLDAYHSLKDSVYKILACQDAYDVFFISTYNYKLTTTIASLILKANTDPLPSSTIIEEELIKLLYSKENKTTDLSILLENHHLQYKLYLELTYRSMLSKYTHGYLQQFEKEMEFHISKANKDIAIIYKYVKFTTEIMRYLTITYSKYDYDTSKKIIYSMKKKQEDSVALLNLPIHKSFDFLQKE